MARQQNRSCYRQQPQPGAAALSRRHQAGHRPRFQEAQKKYEVEKRNEGCTYRDIVGILHERVGLEVAVSTIHSFVKVRAKYRKQAQYELPPLESESKSIPVNPNDVTSRIAALRAKPIEQKPKPKHFHFEESEPLKLVSQGGSR